MFQIPKELLFHSLSCRTLENCPCSYVCTLHKAHNAFLSTSFFVLSVGSIFLPKINSVFHLSIYVWGTFPVSTLSCRYGMAVSWLTALVMTVVHDRVPDMAKYAKV